MSGPPRIVITGPPASGKTTVRGVAVQWLTEQGGPIESVSVDDAIRRLYPMDRESRDYQYDENGAIVLHRPKEQIRPAVHDAIERCRQASLRGGFAFELASNECEELLRVGREILVGALVVALSAPVELRSQRNAARGRTLIPDDRLRQYPDHLPTEWTVAFEDAGARVASVDGSRAIAAVTAEVLELMARELSSRRFS
ncbi:MAG: AAA family ATPase [Planctomycetota bacterium]|jgi:thymidylate kinase